MSDEQRLEIMKKLQQRNNTHSCPGCSSPTYCAMQDGKSGSACWCAGEVISSTLPAIEGAQCVCKTCLITPNSFTTLTPLAQKCVGWDFSYQKVFNM